MDAYDPATVFSSIDRGGRYAYRNQPAIAQWNLACLARALIPILGAPQANAVAAAQALIDGFPDQFQAAYHTAMTRKLGLTQPRPEDSTLVDDLLTQMHETGADYTLTFRALGEHADPEGSQSEPVTDAGVLSEALAPWRARWTARLAEESQASPNLRAHLHAANPAFIPRNHQVEAAIDAAVENADFKPFHRLVEVLAQPFQDQPEHADLMAPPRPDQKVHRTFCGT